MFIKFKTENLIAELQNLNRKFIFSWVSLIGFSTTWPEGATLLGWPKSIYYNGPSISPSIGPKSYSHIGPSISPSIGPNHNPRFRFKTYVPGFGLGSKSYLNI